MRFTLLFRLNCYFISFRKCLIRESVDPVCVFLIPPSYAAKRLILPFLVVTSSLLLILIGPAKLDHPITLCSAVVFHSILLIILTMAATTTPPSPRTPIPFFLPVPENNSSSLIAMF
uniref:Uncharacterized protein n=1 Tax=Anguilla anguilla TaxID=7936 RepID=A0A0E9X1T8_ANGAN